jgi:hypothetical protein
MLWYYNKISEDDNSVVYAYGWNTEKTTGQLKYNKTTQDIIVLNVADNDNQEGARWAASHLPPVLLQKGFPEKAKVMIG